MKYVLVLALVALVAAASVSSSSRVVEQFSAFKAAHNKQYPTAAVEAKRFAIFAANMKKAALLHAANPLAEFGASVFADLTEEEFKPRHNIQAFLKKRASKPRNELPRQSAAERAAVPTKIDWRTKGAVTYVKNQGQCGSCWSFSTTGSIEGQWFLAGNKLVALSEQELVSCDTIDDGCGGGFQDDAFEWLFFNTNGTITTEAAYPYVSGDGVAPACKSPASLPFGAQISAYADVARSETVMGERVGTAGPLAVSLDATSFQLYMSGILTDCISLEIDHAVLIVGYDETNSPPYWIIKNSWGASWGESGYIRVEKGTNQCLIADMPTTAIVTPGPHPTPAPAPWTPAPAGPTPPSPTPSGATYTQKVCTDSACTQGCQTQTLAQNTCLQTPDGYSAIAKCTPTGLSITLYLFSTDCTGLPFEKTEPLNQCGLDSDGTYIENICPSGSGAAAQTTTLMRLAKDATRDAVVALKRKLQ